MADPGLAYMYKCVANRGRGFQSGWLEKLAVGKRSGRSEEDSCEEIGAVAGLLGSGGPIYCSKGLIYQ